ncbi:phospholipase D-like domain-containing protein [Pseudodesulfovibrio portus]|uniref:PLD phosphodiesterase domain-containing protein n=1 Tax=Pseudodesulfovibrio portus TaxID=231439 RepID=A0ABM8APR0_9BACT|nr:hypothetical protein [Pseudodesulfovibrio portus]BDQ33393.1 hypothetical protein JCM14722_09350 [Pseudodesulfovibrio portus]
MSNAYHPPSLLRHFESPDEYTGVFGWLCGYSADAWFLDEALELFSGKTHAQRAYEGRICIAMILDPGAPQLTMVAVPGLAHLPVMSNKPLPCNLLHAKVAILAFRHGTDRTRWCVRLIVSTGNWTRQSVEDSLDLAWRVDLTSEDIVAGSSENSGDIWAAWDFLNWTSSHFDKSLLSVSRDDLEENPDRFFERIISLAGKRDNKRSRFFDNRNESLLAQLPRLIKKTSPVRRNYIAMGSGFYEKATNDAVPSVLQNITEALVVDELLTASADKNVFVNPEECQAIANSREAMLRNGYSIYRAAIPPYMREQDKFLHAKFIFSANDRSDSDYCGSPWVYLGSGNLTKSGFASKASLGRGNLEAGVVFSPGNVYWGESDESLPQRNIKNLLPIGWDDQLRLTEECPLLPGEGFPGREDIYTASPVSWLIWEETRDGNQITIPRGFRKQLEQSLLRDMKVLDRDGEPCPKVDAHTFHWLHERPRMVTLSWPEEDKSCQSDIPLVDEFGRLAATPLPQLGLSEAWSILANFPMPPDGLEPEDLQDQPQSEEVTANSCTALPQGQDYGSDYPVRKMMQLVESIAGKQTAIDQPDWSAWCTRLEQCLTQVGETTTVSLFKKLEIDPLSPLAHPSFRPEYAETANTPEGKRYETILRKITKRWGMERVTGIGEIR